MKLKEKISLEKVFEKEYKDKLVEPKSNKEAVITHFLHNSNNGVSRRKNFSDNLKCFEK
jgi:DNA (cytosine-5)-methyltransferase 1